MPFEKGKSGNELTQFKKGQSGNPKGRPKSIYTILKRSGYNWTDIYKCFQELAFYYIEDLKEILDNKEKYPLIILVMARAYYKALTNGDFAPIEKIMQYTLPKADAFLSDDSRKLEDKEIPEAIIIEIPQDGIKKRKDG